MSAKRIVNNIIIITITIISLYLIISYILKKNDSYITGTANNNQLIIDKLNQTYDSLNKISNGLKTEIAKYNNILNQMNNDIGKILNKVNNIPIKELNNLVLNNHSNNVIIDTMVHIDTVTYRILLVKAYTADMYKQALDTCMKVNVMKDSLITVLEKEIEILKTENYLQNNQILQLREDNKKLNRKLNRMKLVKYSIVGAYSLLIFFIK